MAENTERNEVYANAVRAGKRTYFFDVKETRKGEYYLTLTESKRRFNKEQGKFFYEKHKLFLYKEDFEKFTNALEDVMEFIRNRQSVIEKTHDNKITDSSDQQSGESPTSNAENTDTGVTESEGENQSEEQTHNTSDFSDISFEDLDSETNKKE